MRRAAIVAAPLVALAACASALGYFSGTTGATGSFTSAPDWTAPTQSAWTIQKAEGGIAGFVRPGGGYRAFASVTDSGNPAAGIGSVTADVSALTSGQTAAALSSSGGPFTADGASYSHRSASLTVGAGVTAGSKSWSVAATDAATNAATTTGLSVTVDATAPAGSDVQTANGGATVGKPEAGDTITLTYSEPIEPESILAGWSGASTNVVVRLGDVFLGNDTAQVRNAANSAALPLGTLTLGGGAFVSATVDFGASGTPSTMTRSGNAVVVTLGTPSSGSTGTAVFNTSLSWTPSATATDRAGNASSTATASESGGGDKDF